VPGTKTDMNMSPAVWGMLILLSVVWGGTFFFQEIAVRELPVFTIVAVRVILAAAILLAVVVFSGARLPRELKVWRALFLLALINNVIPFCLIVWGQKEIASGLTSISSPISSQRMKRLQGPRHSAFLPVFSASPSCSALICWTGSAPPPSPSLPFSAVPSDMDSGLFSGGDSAPWA
jgi:drug/metabolite transporter (DMT)-like permease